MRKLEDGERIDVTIGTDGEMVVKAVGVKGGACKDVTKFIEKLGQVKSDRPTPEMREEPEGDNRNRARW